MLTGLGPFTRPGSRTGGAWRGSQPRRHQCSERWLRALGLGPDTCRRRFALPHLPPLCSRHITELCFPGLRNMGARIDSWTNQETEAWTRSPIWGVQMALPSPLSMQPLPALPWVPRRHGQRLRCPGDGQHPRSDARVSELFWHCIRASDPHGQKPALACWLSDGAPGKGRALVGRRALPNQGSLETSGPLKVFPSLLVGGHIQRLAKPLAF